jgi:hypothetical protein
VSKGTISHLYERHSGRDLARDGHARTERIKVTPSLVLEEAEPDPRALCAGTNDAARTRCHEEHEDVKLTVGLIREDVKVPGI